MQFIKCGLLCPQYGFIQFISDHLTPCSWWFIFHILAHTSLLIFLTSFTITKHSVEEAGIVYGRQKTVWRFQYYITQSYKLAHSRENLVFQKLRPIQCKPLDPPTALCLLLSFIYEQVPMTSNYICTVCTQIFIETESEWSHVDSVLCSLEWKYSFQ